MSLPTGRCFISYRRNREHEIRPLVQALLDRGVPVWQDRRNLGHEPTEDAIRAAIRSDDISSAILWITPDVESSPMIRDVEIPEIIRRYRGEDYFGVTPVAAAGLAFSQLSSVVGSSIGAQRFEDWNVLKVGEDPVTALEITRVADTILHHRLRTTHRAAEPDSPIEIVINTRKVPPFDRNVALSIDWTGHFVGGMASEGAWSEHLLPALKAVAGAIEAETPGRKVIASGFSSLCVTTALGTVFVDTRGVPINWRQAFPGTQGTQEWGLRAAREESGFAARSRSLNVRGTDLAVLVCVTNDVEQAFAASGLHDRFRSMVKIHREDSASHVLDTPGQALDVALKTQAAIRKMRLEYPNMGQLHLFMAAPAGLTMMIGQLLNTFGPVRTYEFLSDRGAQGEYKPAALLNPSSRT